MRSELNVHRIVGVTATPAQHFEADGASPEFWVRDLLLTDDGGDTVTVKMFSRDGPQCLEIDQPGQTPTFPGARPAESVDDVRGAILHGYSPAAEVPAWATCENCKGSIRHGDFVARLASGTWAHAHCPTTGGSN